jgi:hypothetical protein
MPPCISPTSDGNAGQVSEIPDLISVSLRAVVSQRFHATEFDHIRNNSHKSTPSKSLNQIRIANYADSGRPPLKNVATLLR